MWISALRFSSVLLACGSGLIACAADTDGEVMSSSEEDGEEVMSDEGLDSSADALSGQSPAGATVYTTARVNFRTGPSTNDTILRVIPRGEGVKLVTGTPEANGFYEVTDSRGTGFMHGAYLTAATADAETPPSDDGVPADASRTGRRVSASALYLGSCEFLGRCASSATKRAWSEDRTIIFGCDGRASCDNGEAYLSVPRNGPRCGSVVKICRVARPTECVYAKVRERSDTRQRYELSPAAALAIDLEPHDRYFDPAGGEPACGGTMGGDPRVTISY